MKSRSKACLSTSQRFQSNLRLETPTNRRARIDRELLARGQEKDSHANPAAMAAPIVGQNHSVRPPACRAFQMATILSASAIAFRSASARLASAAALAAARSRSCARRFGPMGGILSTKRALLQRPHQTLHAKIAHVAQRHRRSPHTPTTKNLAQTPTLSACSRISLGIRRAGSPKPD
jgi:hypothetical protein